MQTSGKAIPSLITADSVSFQYSFLHPRYWALWTGIGLLWLITQTVPYRGQLLLGKSIGRLLLATIPSRKKVASRNLQLCFPDMPEDQRTALLVKNFESTGIALFEMGMAWWWPDKRLSKLLTFKGLEHIEQVQKEGHGILLSSMHVLPLEIGARLFSLKSDGIAVYRTHNNPVMEYLQVKGRLKSAKGLLDKFKLKSAVRALRQGETVWYSSDQDFGPDGAEYVPFFAVPDAATVTGGSTLCKLSRARLMPMIVTRNNDNSGYIVEILPPLDNYPSGDDRADAVRMNKVIEESILKAPEQYMWVHRRFKTRPDGNNHSLYR